MYPVSVSNLPVPERGVFCIFIGDIISRSGLVFLRLLCEINITINQGSLKVDFSKCKNIHGRLLRIAVLQSISLQWVIKIVVIYIIARYTCGGTFADIFHWPRTIILFFMFFIKLSWKFDFLVNIESVVLWYFQTNFFLQ